MFRMLRSEAFDFGNAMFRLIYRKKFNTKSELDDKCSREIHQIIDGMEQELTVAWYNQMSRMIKRYHFHSYMMKISVSYPEYDELRLIEHIRSIESSKFYHDYINWVLNVDSEDEEAVRESISRMNANNPTLEAPSLTALKELKRRPGTLKDELIDLCESFLPTYLKAKEKVQRFRTEAFEIYQAKIKTLDDFLTLFPLFSRESFKKVTEVECSVSVFLYDALFVDFKEDTCHMLLGSGLTYLLTEEYQETKKQSFFKCLADETKRKMLKAIREEQLCALDLTKRFELSKSTVSHHISQLLAAQIIYLSGKEGKKAYYSVNTKTLEEMFEDTLNEFS